MANNHRCTHCKIVGDVEKCCNRTFPQRLKERMPRLKNQDNENSLQRVNYIEELDKESEEDDEEQLVLRVDGDGCKLFYMEGTMCGD